MSDLFRDTVFGHAVRFITKGRYLQFVEEKDPSIWKQYIDRNQTKNMALYGHPDDESSEEKQPRESAPVSETHRHANANGANRAIFSNIYRGWRAPTQQYDDRTEG